MQPLRSVYNAGFSKLFVNYIGLVYKTEVGDIVPEGIFWMESMVEILSGLGLCEPVLEYLDNVSDPVRNIGLISDFVIFSVLSYYEYCKVLCLLSYWIETGLCDLTQQVPLSMHIIYVSGHLMQ